MWQWANRRSSSALDVKATGEVVWSRAARRWWSTLGCASSVRFGWHGGYGLTQSSSDFDEDLAGLRALGQQADALRRRFAAGQEAGREASAWDSTSSVRVVLTEAGRIGAVEVAANWRRHLTGAELGATVLNGY